MAFYPKKAMLYTPVSYPSGRLLSEVQYPEKLTFSQFRQDTTRTVRMARKKRMATLVMTIAQNRPAHSCQ